MEIGYIYADKVEWVYTFKYLLTNNRSIQVSNNGFFENIILYDIHLKWNKIFIFKNTKWNENVSRYHAKKTTCYKI
jgi:hypothetical protein